MSVAGCQQRDDATSAIMAQQIGGRKVSDLLLCSRVALALHQSHELAVHGGLGGIRFGMPFDTK
jgi:hypothetical protein